MQRVQNCCDARSAQRLLHLTRTESQPSVSFFERLDVVIDTYMQEKKPVAQITTAKIHPTLVRVRQPVVQVGDPPSRFKYQPRHFRHFVKSILSIVSVGR